MDFSRPSFICSHLVTAPDEYYVWFTGQNLDHYWVCGTCAKGYPDRPADLVEATDQLFERTRSEATWEGVFGRPEIKERASSLHFVHEDFPLPAPQNDRWIDIRPNLKIDGEWFILLATGDLWIASPRHGEFRTLFRLEGLRFPIDDETAFCVSSRQDFIAVYQVSSRLADVFHFPTGKLAAQIDRGEYRPENSVFPIAFFECDGHTLLVVATSWNRLDILDPATGRILTERGLTSYRKGEERPPHYLDYFHAQLSVSPNNLWVVDNGWFWHPWGIVRSWNLPDWLQKNVWESEDGSSLRALTDRAYFWDGPLCWIADSTVAIWGRGRDDEWLIPAVTLIDARDGSEIGWFPGPECRPPTAWPAKKVPPSLFFDGYLFSVHEKHGTMVWDIATGERLLQDPCLKPLGYHSLSREFLTESPSGVRLSRLTE